MAGRSRRRRAGSALNCVGYHVDPRSTFRFDHYGNHVDPPLRVGHFSVGQIAGAESYQLARFLRCDGILRTSVSAGGPGLDFDDDDLAGVFADNVDFAELAAVVSLDYPIAALQQFGLGKPLAVCSQVFWAGEPVRAANPWKPLFQHRPNSPAWV